MQINISTRHGQINEETHNKVTSRMEKLTRIFDRLTSIEVTLDLEHREALKVDLHVSAEHKHDFVANAQGEELVGVLDNAAGKIEKQLRKYKEKLQSKHRATSHRDAEE